MAEALKKLNGDWIPQEGDKADYEESGVWKKVILMKIDKTDPEKLIFEIENEDKEIIKEVPSELLKA